MKRIPVCINDKWLLTQVSSFYFWLYSEPLFQCGGPCCYFRVKIDKFQIPKRCIPGRSINTYIVLYLSVFPPILEKLQQNESFGYPINDTKYITTPFADDFNFITTNKRTHQRLLNKISKWTKSMNLKLKPVKCKLLSLVSGNSLNCF